MIYFTGDTHGDWMQRLTTTHFVEQREMTKDDYVVVCGDFGIWADTPSERYALDWLDAKPFTTLFVGGNHENYDRLYSNEFERQEWNGGMIQNIRPSVKFLERGYIFNIDGKKFFAMGGASSHDIQDGILEPDDPRCKSWNKDFSKMFRVNHVSWWKQELPSLKEYNLALKNLDACDWQVDGVITHCCPSSVLDIIGGGAYFGDHLTDFFETVFDKLDFKRWYFGHYHTNQEIGDKFVLLFHNIVPFAESRFPVSRKAE